MPTYAYHKHHLHRLSEHYLAKASCEISVSSLKHVWSKGEKSAKTHILCTIYD